MRCLSCDKALNAYESTRKTISGKYVDLCNSCFRTIRYEIPSIGRADLESEVDADVVDILDTFPNTNEDY